MVHSPLISGRGSCATAPSADPRAGGPQYGVIEASEVLHAAPVMVGLGALADDPDPLFRLNEDMWAKACASVELAARPSNQTVDC